MPPTKKQAIDFATVQKIAMKLPDVEAKKSTWGPSLKVGGKLLACMAINKSAEPNSLMLRIPRSEREELISASPEICYVTDHYVGYPSVLVRLAKVDRKSLEALLHRAWRFAKESGK